MYSAGFLGIANRGRCLARTLLTGAQLHYYIYRDNDSIKLWLPKPGEGQTTCHLLMGRRQTNNWSGPVQRHVSAVTIWTIHGPGNFQALSPRHDDVDAKAQERHCEKHMQRQLLSNVGTLS